MSGPSQQPGEMPRTDLDAAEADPTAVTDYPHAQAGGDQTAARPVASTGSEGAAAPLSSDPDDPDGLPEGGTDDDAGQDLQAQRDSDEAELRAEEVPTAVVDDVLPT